MDKTITRDLSADRRSFLKTSALVTAPLAALAAPALAQAADESGARLARLEDERAIEQLQRAFLRSFNGTPNADCSAFIANEDAVSLEAGRVRNRARAGRRRRASRSPGMVGLRATRMPAGWRSNST